MGFAEVPTSTLSDELGIYAICDAALRAHIDSDLMARLGVNIEPQTNFPFPAGY
jgi:hypothetical protein